MAVLRKLVLKNVLLVSMVSFFPFGLHAEDKSSGCGLGWSVAPQNSLISSYTRSITNGSTSSTSGMTSGTSGCDKHSIVSKEKRDIHYAEGNYHNLMIEMAQGQGEFVKGFALVMGCSPSEASHFSKSSQANYDRLFPASNASPNQLLNSMRETIKLENICAANNI